MKRRSVSIFVSLEGRDHLYQYNQKESMTIHRWLGLHNNFGNNIPIFYFSYLPLFSSDMFFLVFLGVGGFSLSANAF